MIYYYLCQCILQRAHEPVCMLPKGEVEEGEVEGALVEWVPVHEMH